MSTFTIQPGQPGEGMAYNAMKTLPYPYHIDTDTGAVGRQDFWRGDPAMLIGFQADPEVHHVDLPLREWVQHPQKAVGLFPLFARGGGDWYTLMVPITSVSV